MRARGLVDLLVPRGGAGLIRTVVENVHRARDRDRHRQLPRLRRRERRPRARRSRSPSTPRCAGSACATPPRRCSCTRTPRRAFLPRALPALRAAGRPAARRRRGRAAAAAARGRRRRAGDGRGLGHRVPLRWTSRSAWSTSLDAAVEHIRRWSSGHTEAICTARPAGRRRVRRAGRLRRGGGERLHGVHRRRASSASAPRSASRPRSCTPAGPMGLAELTSTKWVVAGDGHVRP